MNYFRKEDVKEEAKRGLKPNVDDCAELEISIGRYPSFIELCDYLHLKVPTSIHSVV